MPQHWIQLRKREDAKNGKQNNETNYKTIVGAAIAAFIAIGGWFVVSKNNLSNDIASKVGDMKMRFEKDAYDSLNVIFQDSANGVPAAEHIRRLDKVYSDIQFFGTDEQVDLANKEVDSAVDGYPMNVNAILILLRADLRKYYGLTPIVAQPRHLKFDKLLPSDHAYRLHPDTNSYFNKSGNEAARQKSAHP